MKRTLGLIVAGLLTALALMLPPVASAELEGIRDCGDVRSASWNYFDGSRWQEHNFWVVFAGKGIGPSCNFAKKWARKGVRKAVAPANREYRRRLRGKAAPSGWKCWVESAPEPVVSTGGLLQCLRYRGRKLTGSFSATPDLDILRTRN